jgi:hypothetical protein
MDQPVLSEIKQWLTESGTKTPQVIHADTLLKTVGVLGILMPWLLMAGSWLLGSEQIIQDSISDYYHSPKVRDLFVGVLCAIAFFLSAYNGYDRRDRIASALACVFALGVAFFPTTPDGADPDTIGRLHLVFAGSFFIVLTVFALYLFRSFDADKGKTPQKADRNRVYFICGMIMAASLLILVVYIVWLEGRWAWLDKARPVLVFEAAALSAFGFSWLVKGGFILRDRPAGKRASGAS